MTAEHRAYLLVYHASRPGLPGERWVDRGNDPELRVEPMTYGICRPDIRRDVSAGDDLFFVAFDARRPSGDRYYLSAHLRVGERLGHDRARRVFGRRPNVLLDLLPEGGSDEARVLEYASRHQVALRWSGWIRPRLSTSELRLRVASELNNLVWRTERGLYVHSFWDHHKKWRECLDRDAAYLVGDASSKVLATPISYQALYESRPLSARALPDPARLRARGGELRHNKRRLRGRELDYLRDVVAAAASLRRDSAAA